MESNNKSSESSSEDDTFFQASGVLRTELTSKDVPKLCDDEENRSFSEHVKFPAASESFQNSSVQKVCEIIHIAEEENWQQTEESNIISQNVDVVVASDNLQQTSDNVQQTSDNIEQTFEKIKNASNNDQEASENVQKILENSSQNSTSSSETSETSSETSDVAQLSGESTTDDSEDGDEVNKIFNHKR